MSLYLIWNDSIEIKEVEGPINTCRLRVFKRIYSLNKRRLIKTMPGAGNNRVVIDYNGSGHACSRIGRSRIPLRGMVVSNVPNAVGGRKGHQDPGHKVRLKYNKTQKKALIQHAWRAWANIADVFLIKDLPNFSGTRSVTKFVETVLERTQKQVRILFATDNPETYRCIRNLTNGCIDLRAPNLHVLTGYAPRRAIMILSENPPHCLL